MISKRRSKNVFRKAFLGCFFAIILMFSSIFGVLGHEMVYADPENNSTENSVDLDAGNSDNNENTTEDGNEDSEGDDSSDDTQQESDEPQNSSSSSSQLNTSSVSGGDNCKSSLGAIGWLVCPTTGKIAEAVDWLYDKIEGILAIKPVAVGDGSPIYEVWKYCRGLTNVVFIIFLLVVIYSQITGYGITNYGLKRSLPKLIIAAILVNLSFLICSLAVDVSNIVGSGLRGVFGAVEETVLANMATEGTEIQAISGQSFVDIYTALIGGTALTVLGGAIAFELGAIWMLIPVVLGALVSVASGLITIALRQAVVALLIMISPLAFVAFILPNTEKWFKKWKDLLMKMLVFYPMFSLLFGASSLAGFAIIASAKDGFGLLLGVAVQVFPLFFSWSLMKMSGTFLGDINAKMQGLATRPLAANRAWADARRQQTNLNMLALGRTPMSHLRRYMDGRRALREEHKKNLVDINRSKANKYAQKIIGGKYDGTKALGNSAYLKPNKYTRAAKEASIWRMKSETATMDTAHVLNNYGDYFVSSDIRKKVKEAEKAGENDKADTIRRNDVELRRSVEAGKAYLEHSRAQMTKENDEEADYNFMVQQYQDASTKYNPKDVDSEQGRKNMEKYRHYIVSSAGGLGETGQMRVLGKILSRAAAVESNQRRDISIVAAKFPPDKRNFRNFLFNYYVDDNGYATDKEGKPIESMRDYLRVNKPSDLVAWDHVDENGPYFDWYDTDGKYVTRIYKKDKPAIKELMSNFDVPINDPINNLLAIHAGIEENPKSDIPVLRNMGLYGFRTTIGRALQSASFKEKNAAFSPMVAEMIKKGYIENYAQENLAYLDSLNKATKPGAWNMQDGDAIEMFTALMDPDRWEEVFPTELIRGYRNVNGERIYGIRFNEDGSRTEVDANKATREELMARVTEKFIIPAAKKITVMMSRQTQNTMDNQKAGTIEKWKKLKEVFDTKWGENGVMGDDAYKQNGDMRQITKEIRESLYTVDENGNTQRFVGGGRSPQQNNGRRVHVNHSAQIFEIYNSSLDVDDFATSVSQYCAGFVETAWIADQIQDYIVSEGYGVTKEQVYERVEELLAYVDYD